MLTRVLSWRALLVNDLRTWPLLPDEPRVKFPVDEARVARELERAGREAVEHAGTTLL